ncbi:helix-turn-helix domain-containing protein [Flaviaesturariibacter amylovorans]|uniref:Helix-turn-helix domain-containing protein n=1 Tax=Flaviaesturariibacter amylovorans TaxID=1084520 RepID=A0ABP8GQB6_9BACT
MAAMIPLPTTEYPRRGRKPGRPIEISEDEKTRMRAAREQGKGLRAIASQFGGSLPRVREIVSDVTVQKQEPEDHALKIAEAVRLFEAGECRRNIARALHVHHNTVRDWLCAEGLLPHLNTSPNPAPGEKLSNPKDEPRTWPVGDITSNKIFNVNAHATWL